jgi:hypothetical protein
MNDHDELTERVVLSTVRDSMSVLPLPAAPHVETITARARARRQRRVGGLSIAAAGACAALAVGLLGGSGGAGPAAQHGDAAEHHNAAQHHATPVQLTAFSVVTGAGGSTTLTLYPGEAANPSAVRQALAEHGIPALVTAGQFCQNGTLPGWPGINQVATLSPTGLQHATSGRAAGLTVVIHGSAIPSGAKLSIGYRQDLQNREISFKLIQDGAPLTCTSLPDSGPHGND